MNSDSVLIKLALFGKLYACPLTVLPMKLVPAIVADRQHQASAVSGLWVENPHESGFESGRISCRFSQTSGTPHLVKALCHQFVFSQPYMERKDSLVNRAEKGKRGVPIVVQRKRI